MTDSGARVFLLQKTPALVHWHEDHASDRELRDYAIADEFYA